MTFTILFILFLQTVHAGESANVKAELFSEINSVMPSRPFWVAVKLTHANWHTYWRNSGDAGLSTSIDWKLPDGFIAGEIQWPYPDTDIVDDITTYVFNSTKYLLIEIFPPQTIETPSITLEAEIDWLECKEICIPGTASLKLTLPVGKEISEINSPLSKIFEETRARLPEHAAIEKLSAVRNNDLIVLNWILPGQKHEYGDEIKFIPYEEGIYDDSAPPKIESAGNRFTIEIKLDKMRIKEPEILEGIILINPRNDGHNFKKSFEIKVNIQ